MGRQASLTSTDFLPLRQASFNTICRWCHTTNHRQDAVRDDRDCECYMNRTRRDSAPRFLIGTLLTTSFGAGPNGQPDRGERVRPPSPTRARAHLPLPNPLLQTLRDTRVSPNQATHRIITTAGRTILNNGGVVRAIDNWGVFSLPRPISRSQMMHHNGHYFVMRYDAGTRTQEMLRSNLSQDVRVLRTTSVKLGDGKLETLSKFGQFNWVESL